MTFDKKLFIPPRSVIVSSIIISVIYLSILFLLPPPNPFLEQLLITPLLVFGGAWLINVAVDAIPRFLVCFYALFPLFNSIIDNWNYSIYSRRLFEHTMRYSLLLTGSLLLVDLGLRHAAGHYKRLGIFIRIIALLFPLSLFTLPAVILSRKLIDSAPLSPENLVAVYQTDWKEGFNFFLDSPALLTAAGLILLFVIALIVFAVRKKPANPWKPWHFTSLILVGILLFIGLLRSPKLYTVIMVKHSFTYFDEIRALNSRQTHQEKLPPEQAEKLLCDKARPIRMVFILGESHNRNYTTGYGNYTNPTMPFFNGIRKNPHYTVMEQAYSSHVMTVYVLKQLFTSWNNYNNFKLPIEKLVTLYDVLRHCGVYSSFISNQFQSGKQDSPVTAITLSADKVIWLNQSIDNFTGKTHPDGDLLAPYLTLPRQKKEIIVLHMFGAHPRHELRLPYPNYAEDLFPTVFERNMYYVDECLKNFMEAMTSGENAADVVIYCSDHSTIPNKGHDPAKFTPELAEIPMFIYLSDDFRQKYPETAAHVEKARTKVFTNDLMFDLILRLFGIEHSFTPPSLNILDDGYELDYNSARTLHGRVHLDGMPVN